jgi:NAD(P)H-dependent FMN reductase
VKQLEDPMTARESVLKIVIASTRPGRLGAPIAHWLADRARHAEAFDRVEILDLAEFDLPLFDEPHHPRTGRYVHPHTKAWSAAVDDADALVFVSPEYNGFPPATLINAVDFLHAEWVGTPLGVLTYGAGGGGARARQQLELLGGYLQMPIADANFGLANVFGQVADGVFTPAEGNDESAAALVDELARLARAADLVSEAA